MASTATVPLCKHRYGLFISYLGHRYQGSQRITNRAKQNDQSTIQEAIEWSLESFLPRDKCRVTACSRTDKGVHALMNCYTLPLMQYDLPTEKLKRLANFNLMSKMHDITINEVLLVPAEFHPRRAAIGREYIYRIAAHNNGRRGNFCSKVKPSELFHQLPVTELYKVLPLPSFNYEKALEAISVLRGTHDFASFGYKLGDRDDTVRDLEINISEIESMHPESSSECPFTFYQLRFRSRAFLYNQIRRMVGTIITYATYNRISLEDIKKLIDEPTTKAWKAPITIADPWGLFLSKIEFDKSALEGTIKTYEDNSEEKITSYSSPFIDEALSDDENKREKI